MPISPRLAPAILHHRHAAQRDGHDGVATGLAWQPDGTVWYTTGGENELGNVGRIDLSTFVTTRVLTSISATSIIL